MSSQRVMSIDGLLAWISNSIVRREESQNTTEDGGFTRGYNEGYFQGMAEIYRMVSDLNGGYMCHCKGEKGE